MDRKYNRSTSEESEYLQHTFSAGHDNSAKKRLFSPQQKSLMNGEYINKLTSNDSTALSQNLSTNESFQQMRNQLKELSDAIKFERKGTVSNIIFRYTTTTRESWDKTCKTTDEKA